MKLVVGSSVEGPNFFGRLGELAELDSRLAQDHVLLLAPRRVGKSSLLKAYRDRARTDGADIVYADVQDVRPGPDTETTFVGAVLDALYQTPAGRRVRPGWWARWRAARGSRLTKVDTPVGGAEVEHLPIPWQRAADQAFDPLLAAGRRWIVLLDELPNVVQALAQLDASGERARAFLAWFRALRNRSNDAGAPLRFVVCGSIGLDNVARRLRCTDTINDLNAWTIGAFSNHDADAFLVALAQAYGVTLSPEVRAAVIAAVEWPIPHHLQALAQELFSVAARAPLAPSTVETAIEALVANRTYFNTWDERLTSSLGAPHDDHARAILIACARDPAGFPRDHLGQLLAEAGVAEAERARARTWLEEALTHDGYLIRHGDRLRFRSALLRRYWLRNFV
jgi:hypothetical protein